MVRNFKGVVKVADVQAEFDALLNRINTAIDLYNSSLNVEDVDYNNGGSDLAALGYTLSVGGLKKVLAAFDGALLGGQVLRVSNGNYIVSEGLYIKDGLVTRLPSKAVAGSGNILYYNTSSNNYSFSTTSSQTGYYQDIVTTTTTPNISGSNSASLGTLGDTGAVYYNGNNFVAYAPYMSFPSNSANWFLPSQTNGMSYTLTWNFLNPTELQSITLTYGGFSGGKITITDLNNRTLLTNTVSGTGTGARKNYTGTFSTGTTKYNGIKIKVECTAGSSILLDSLFGRLFLGNIKLTGKTTTRVFVPASAGDPEDFIPIAMINSNRISRLCNTQKAINEDIPGYTLKIESNGNNYGMNVNQTLSNSTKGQFYSGSAGRNCRINLFGTQVAYHQWHGDATDSYWEPFSYMFIPKGISNPYTGLAGETRFAGQRVWNYILTRPER